MRKREIYTNKPIYSGQAISDISKTLMYEFWYDYLLPMYGENIKLCYMDTDSFIIYVKTDDITKILVMLLINGLILITMVKILIDH